MRRATVLLTLLVAGAATAQVIPSRGQLEWVRGGRSGRLPADAVATGADPATFICRIDSGGASAPGELTGRRCLVVIDGAVEERISAFDVLTGEGVLWALNRDGDDRLRPAAVSAGGAEDGPYVCRAECSEHSTHVGRTDDFEHCSIIHDGVASDAAPPFEVLISRADRRLQRSGGKGHLARRCQLEEATPSVASMTAQGVAIGPKITIKGVAGARILRVEQDECVYRKGRKDPAPDAIMRSDRSFVRLRRQRLDPEVGGDGRVYRIHFEVDGCGEGFVDVCVPLEPGGACVDSGLRFDSTSASLGGVAECERPDARETGGN